MKKRILILGLVLVVCMVAMFAVACNKTPTVKEPEKTIVYLGDSIAEALIGPSPLSERDNYGYYALVARTNNFKYYNHSVSGHKTSGDMLGNSEGGLLYLLRREDESATLMKTHIKQADIIHISIGGNNLLQYDLGLLMMEVADPDFEENYERGKTAENDDEKTLINLLHDGGATTRKSISVDKYGNHWDVNFNFPNTYQDLCDVIAILREMNPDAKIFFQKVYNPVVGGSKFLYPELLEELAKIEDDGRFGAEGTKITTIEQVRAVAQELLNHLNGMFDEYLAAHPNSIYIVDANKAFDDYAKTDVRDGKVYYGTLASEGADCKGAELFFSDWTHPSNIGHAVLAETTQALFEEMGLASDDAVNVYKQIKVEQLNRMYSSINGFDVKAAVASVNSATTYREVTNAYFGATKGLTPNYTDNTQKTYRGDAHFENDMLFTFDNDSSAMGLGFKLIANLLLNKSECYFTFTSTGKVHGQIVTKSNLMSMLGTLMSQFNIDVDNLSEIDLDEAIVEPYVVEMFPGFTLDHIEESFNLMKDSLGLSLIGIDFESDIIKEIERTHRIPDDIFDRIPADFSFGIAFDQEYFLKTVTDADGNEMIAIYVGGDVAHNENTQPFIIFTLTEKQGKKQLGMTVEFLMVNLVLDEQM